MVKVLVFRNLGNMKVLVNKNQSFDDYESFYEKYMNTHFDATYVIGGNQFQEEDINVDKLLEYIKKGYGIKINCN